MTCSKYVKSPSFCYITPISMVSQFAASTTHLVLAHLVDESEEYAHAYKSRSESGHFIMMDNSAYELKEPYRPEKLLELAKKCGAHAVVLPDYPFRPCIQTINAAEEYAQTFKDAGLLTFFVPQSQVGDLEDWVGGYLWAANNPNIDIIGMSILGIPNALPAVDPSYARVVMSQLLLDRGVFAKDKHHHYLGLNAGPALEIPSLLRMGTLDTIDSSNPVWMAVLGHEYTANADSYLSVRKVNMPVDFHMSFPKDTATQERVRHNIVMTQKLFDNYTTGRVWYAQE